MDLSSSDLPNEITTIVKEVTVKKTVIYEITATIPVNYVLEMHDINDNDFTPDDILLFLKS